MRFMAAWLTILSMVGSAFAHAQDAPKKRPIDIGKQHPEVLAEIQKIAEKHQQTIEHVENQLEKRSEK